MATWTSNKPNGQQNPLTVGGRASATREGEDDKALIGPDRVPQSQWRADSENCPWSDTYKKLQDKCI